DILNLRNHQWTMNVGAGGTLTFITDDKKYFGILGHDYFNDIKFKNVKVYTTKDVYINKDINTLSGSSIDQYIGSVTHSSKEGTFGVVDNFDKIPIIGKYGILPLEDVKKGEGYIVSQNPKTQECEKTKVDILGKDGLPLLPNMYSIVYKLDKDSITTVREKVGRGYSGSPIMQDQKIIGATSVGYNLNKDNKVIYYSIGFLGKYTGGIDIYKYLYRLNNLTDEYKIIK
ncbi:MAG: SpoIVB peptidase S55 domain-containing protein, partial [Romboutsia sp.]|uniref:SpoIVB peptidase S55 domain-containing protein n=1 Tax=Romboutsia sp. TaxID=1965302 RepID=UPI003F39CB4D